MGIIFISKKREDIIGKEKIEGAPDIIIEILSPSTAYYDMIQKFRVCEKHGVKEYWLLDPLLKKIEVYINYKKKFEKFSETEAKGSVASKILKGFKVTINEIF